MLKFTWDEQKEAANRQKHGVSFDEARTVFFDEHARLIADPDSSDDEDRFILLGYSERPRLLVVCHCYRENDSIIRIISARKASRPEKNTYGRFRK
jgi:uncharacterized DUF497 family protein